MYMTKFRVFLVYDSIELILVCLVWRRWAIWPFEDEDNEYNRKTAFKIGQHTYQNVQYKEMQ